LFKEDEKVVNYLVHVYGARGQWVNWRHWLGDINIFMDDTLYSVKKYVYLVEMLNFYEWVLCVIAGGEFTVHVASLTYYEDTHIVVKFDARNDMEEFLNIELTEMLAGDIRGYDVNKKILYSLQLILQFKEQFAARNKEMKELAVFYL
jgi:serine/threonine protein kinase HipA of HipAB toxin-antitoxin module